MSAKHENIIDEIREQNQKFKDMSFKKKLEYFWEYYRFPTIAVIGIAILIISMAHSMIANSKETVLYAALVNGSAAPDYEAMQHDYADSIGVDLNDVFVTIDTSFNLSSDLTNTSDLAAVQKLMALSAANQIDIMTADEQVGLYLAGNGYFADLRTVLPSDALAKYEPYFVYYTYDPVAQKARMEAAGMPYEEDSLGPYHTMEPVPYAISSEAFSGIMDKIYYGMPSVAGICVSSNHAENAVAFLTFLESYEQ